MTESFKLGISNKFFYYTLGNRNSFNIKFKLGIRNLELEKLKEAFSEALERYPELGTQVYIKDNKLVSRVSDGAVVFRKYGSPSVYFGTEDTNGLMFYVLYKADEITVSYYHGLTDITGMKEYLRCVMYLYSQKIGFELSTDELEELLPTIREEKSFEGGDDLLDPYAKYGNANAALKFSFENSGAYKLPLKEPTTDEVYCYSSQIKFDFSSVIKRTKDLGVSVTPFIIDTVIRGIFGGYNVEDETVISMLPVDMRRYFGSKNVVNFSDSVFLSFSADDMKLPVDKRCLRIKELINKQSSVENFSKIMGDKVNAVEAFEKLPIYQNDDKPENEDVNKDDFNPLTIVTTYLGKLSLLSGLDRLITDMDIYGYALGNAIVMNTYGNEARIHIMSTSEDASIAKAVYNGLVQDGYEPQLEVKGRLDYDYMMIERLYYE